jgi:very-short-patch-repair endonuclease
VREKLKMTNPKKKAERLPEYILKLCRQFRKNPTDTEAWLWQCLRKHQLGSKFRRQHPIGRYIADFYCNEYQLIIEIDGGIHLKKDQKLYDDSRQENLEAQGYRVMRFTTREVENNPQEILEKISKALSPNPLVDKPSPPSPLPRGEGIKGGQSFLPSN